MRTNPALVGLLLLALMLAACAPAGGPDRTADASSAAPAAASLEGVTAVVFKSPTCGCCAGHEDHLRGAGLAVHSVAEGDVTRLKDSFGVPAEMRSCHTTSVGEYFVEGHVPVAAIARLLAEQPDIDGIALPGMPAGSPGMGGTPAGPLTVYAIRDGQVLEVFGDF